MKSRCLTKKELVDSNTGIIENCQEEIMSKGIGRGWGFREAEMKE